MSNQNVVRAAYYLRISTEEQELDNQGKRLGRPPLPEETVRTVLSLNQDAGIGARKIAKRTGLPLGTVSAILSRSRQEICWSQL